MVDVPMMVAAQAGAAWTPEDLGSKLVGWWDPDSGVTLRSLLYVEDWADRVNGLSFAEAVAAKQLSWLADANGSGGSGLVGAAAQGLTLSGLSTVQPLGFAFQAAHTVSGVGCLLAGPGGSDYYVTGSLGGNDWWVAWSLNVRGGTWDALEHFHVVQVDGASSFIRLDGVEIASGNMGTSGGGTIHLMRRSNDSQHVTGWLRHFVMFQGTLTASELAELEAFLADN